MKNLVILGGGTAGTMAANKLRKKLDKVEWQITVVDRHDKHDYQPGYLFIPFGVYQPDEVTKSRRKYVSDDVPIVYGDIDRVDAEARTVSLTNGTVLPYDQLVIATGVTPRPDQTPGMDDPESGYTDSSTSTPSRARRPSPRSSRPGRAAGSSSRSSRCRSSARWHRWSSCSSPKSFFTERGMRDQVEITYVTPPSSAFTKPICSERFGHLLDEGRSPKSDETIEGRRREDVRLRRLARSRRSLVYDSVQDGC